MTYLNLKKTELVNLEYSLRKEVLRTNRSGSYSSTTVVGCNTRKYHGSLVCPVKELDNLRHVLLSSLDISLIQHQQSFNLGIHKYPGNNYEPQGHKYMIDVEVETTPKRIYRVGGMVLSTEILMAENEEQVMYRVTLEEAHSPTKIRFTPFLAFRDIHSLTKQNMDANTRSEEVQNGMRVKMYENLPYLYMQTNKRGEFIHSPDWYRDIEYIKEKERGYEHLEDLFVPGFFELDIAKGESLIFSASTFEINSRGLKAKFTRQQSKRTPRNTLLNNLLNSAQQFIQVRDKQYKLLAGYHWYDERLRDTLISLPDLMNYQKDKTPYLNILDQAVKDIDKTYLNYKKDGSYHDILDVDIPLWLFYTIQRIEKQFDIDVCERYGKIMSKIIDFGLSLDTPHVKTKDSGLIWASKENVAMTWMDAKVNGIPVTPRGGYVVEVNALWYNALKYYLTKCKSLNKNTKQVEDFVEKLENAFISKFWNEERGYLNDFVSESGANTSIRPNQLIAASLEYSPLDIEKRKQVIDIVKKELLTSKGVRSLSPSDELYEGEIIGDHDSRARALHQGTVYPWLSGFFAEGYLQVHKKGGLGFIKRMVEDFEIELSDHCLSTISEYFDGNPPYRGKGAISMAWSVAAVIRIIKLIEKYN